MSEHAYDLAEAHRRISNLVRVGTVSSVDLDAEPPTARVMFTEGWESGDLTWAPKSAGRWRTWEPMFEGDQVLVQSLSGDTGNGIITHRLNSAANPAPSASADIDILGDWADGGSDLYDSAAHTRTITAPVGGKVIINCGSATVTIQDGVATIDAPAIKLGAGASAGVARVGDHVHITSGSSAGLWPIVEGSSVVSAG